MIALLSELTARHLVKAPLRSALVVLGLVLGTALYLAVDAAAARASLAFGAFVAGWSGGADVSVESPGIGLPGDRSESVAEIPGVARVAPSIEMAVQAADFAESILLVGLPAASARFSPFTLKGGGSVDELAPFADDAHAVFISERFAVRHGLAPGSPLALSAATGPREFVVRDVLSDTGAASAYGGQVAVMRLGALQAAFARGAAVDRIDVALSAGADVDAVEHGLRELFGPGATIGRPERPGVHLQRLSGSLVAALRLSGGLAVFTLAAAFVALVARRLPSMQDGSGAGARGYSGVEPAPVPALRMAVAGTALLLVAWYPALRRGEILGSATVVVAVAGAALLAPILVVWLCRVSARAIVLAGGAPRFGLDYLARTLGRGTARFLVLGLAVATSVSVSGWLASFERSVTDWVEAFVPGDLAVSRGSPAGGLRDAVFASSAAGAVAAVPGVLAVQRSRTFDQLVDDRAVRFVATDADTFIEQAARRGRRWPLARGAPLRRGELEDGPEILLSEGAAHELNKDIGDSVTVHAPKGDVVFVVRGIAVDYAAATAYVDRRHLLAFWGDDTVDGMAVYLATGTEPAKAAESIRAALGSEGAAFVTETSKVRGELALALSPVFAHARSVARGAFGVALLGAVLFALASAWDRRTEVRRLLAGGAPPRDVAIAVLVETGVRGVSAIVAGGVLGVLLRELFVRALLLPGTGWFIGFSMPWPALGAIAGAVALSVVAEGAATWRAASSGAVVA